MEEMGGQIAPAVVEMFASDRASQALGMRIVEAVSGRAVVTMAVREEMVNGLEVCHGGVIFTLADSAMAFASNAHSRSLATNAEMDFVSGAKLGDVLTAVGTVTVRRGKAAIHDVVVTNQNAETIAVFRGRTLSVAPPTAL